MMHSSRKPLRLSKLFPGSVLILFMALLLMPTHPLPNAAELSFDPARIYFGVVPIGKTAYQTLTLTNEDTVHAITVKNIVFNFNQGGAFGFSETVTLPKIIPPGTGMEIKLRFTPINWDTAWADIRICNDSSNHPLLYIDLSAVGIER